MQVDIELEPNKAAEIRTAEESVQRGLRHSFNKPFSLEWGYEPLVKWATIAAAMSALGVQAGDSVLDVGCGDGWTTLFLAEAGFEPLGVDLAPARVQMGIDRGLGVAPRPSSRSRTWRASISVGSSTSCWSMTRCITPPGR